MRILAIIFLFFVVSQAQDSETQGTDFWVSFPPNSHVYANAEQTKLRDSLFIFFSSNVPTDVRFTYWDYEGKEYKQTIRINDVLSYQTFGIPWFDFELPAQDRFNHRFNNGKEYIQEKSKLSIHIESDEPITVLGHNQAKWSSDGMLVYPTKALGNKYIVASYHSIDEYSTFRASHFTVVATEDNTKVTIIPKSALYYTGLDSVSFTLNKGEVYYARASKVSSIDDLTGTEVFADKNISVFSGVERTYVPNDFENSRDYLITQMSPFETSGIEYFVTPFVKNDTLNLFSKFRVIAYYDDTDVYSNDEYITTLDKGEYYEGNIEEAYYIRTSKTSYVYSVRRSSVGSTGFGDSENGDPFLLVNPPIQQFYQSYKVINFQAIEKNIVERFEYDPDLRRNKLVYDTLLTDIYKEHYITLVLKEESIIRTELDFKPLPNDLEYIRIHNTDYLYTHIPVSIGTHLVSSDDPILCFSYGYGAANSYGSVGGGLNLKILDHHAPGINERVDCEGYTVEFTELNENDTGLDSIRVIDNVNIKLDKNIEIDSIKIDEINFTLDNPYEDGLITYRVYDKFGLYRADTIEIPGFTISQEVLDSPIDSRGHRITSDFRYDVKYRNYGKFPQKLEIEQKTGVSLLNNTIPQVLSSNEEFIASFVVYKDNFNKTQTDFSLFNIINHECYPEKDTTFNLNLWIDNNIPEYSLSDFYECEEISNTVVVYDSNSIDYGIKDFNLINSRNVDLTSEFIENNLELKFTLINIKENGFFEIEVSDTLDNILRIEEEISGINLQLEENDTYIFEEVVRDSKRCDDVELNNFSNREIVLEYNSFQENVNFSIPVSQFPIIIPPQESRMIQICFDGNTNAENMKDSLILNLNECVESLFLIESNIIEVDKFINSKCDLNIRLTRSGDNIFTTSSPFPNPTNNIINLNLNNNRNQNINIKLIDDLGNIILNNNSKYEKGLYEIKLELKDIPSGAYSFIISSETESNSYRINYIK